jgi:hypothetical protein
MPGFSYCRTLSLSLQAKSIPSINTMSNAAPSTAAPEKLPPAMISGSHRYRPLVVLLGYIVSTSLYLSSLHIASSSRLAVCSLCMLAFGIPDIMAIKLLGRPYPIVERLLLNLIGPWSSACTLYFVLKLNDMILRSDTEMIRALR